MRINQIIEYKRPRVRGKVSEPIHTSVDDVVQTTVNKSDVDYYVGERLKELGWSQLGMGCFSVVYRHPHKSYVLKVNRRPDIAFQKFVEISKKYPNRHFLKVGDTKVVKFEGQPYYIYTLERLYSVTSLPGTLDIHTLARFIDTLVDSPNQSPEEIISNWYSPKTLLEWIQNHPSIVKACRILGKNKPTASVDIHQDNVMERKDGTIVIVDPFAYYRGDQ